MRAAAVLAALAIAAPAMAAPLTVELAPGVTLDWRRGVVTARGFGPADRNAPSPAVARVAAERRAIDNARAALGTAVAAVPGPRLDPAAPAIARELGLAPVATIARGTDGSVKVEVVLGLEALRQAVDGPRPVTGDDGAPTTVVIDARAVRLTPRVGLAVIGAGGARWRGPVRFVDGAVPAGAIAATAVSADAITIGGAVPGAGAAVVIVVAATP